MTEKNIKKFNIKNLWILLIFVLFTFIFLLNSPSHIFGNKEPLTDSSVFKTVALMMDNGYLPYRDSFDHKGPYIYFINLLGMHISYDNGIWILEFINLLITLYALYKIARLKCNEIFSVVISLLSASQLAIYFQGGNLTEEFAMPFIAISLYIFLDYFINNKVNNKRLIICGMCLGCVLLLRANMIATWIVFCIAILIECIIQKKYDELGKYILFFIIGLAIVMAPVIIWLGANGALIDFWNQYIVFNKMYSSSRFIDKIKCAIKFSVNIYILFSFISMLILGIRKKRKLYIIYISLIIVNIALIAFAGKIYWHYGMVLVPVVTFPIAELVDVLLNRFQSYEKRITWIMSVITFLVCIVTIITPTIIDRIKSLSGNDNIKNNSSIIQEVSQIIKNETESNDKILVNGNWNVIYVVTHRMHATKFSFQYPLISISKEIKAEYFRELKEELPKIIVISEGYNDEMIEFLNENSYSRIWQYDEEIKNPIMVFKRESF